MRWLLARGSMRWLGGTALRLLVLLLLAATGYLAISTRSVDSGLLTIAVAAVVVALIGALTSDLTAGIIGFRRNRIRTDVRNRAKGDADFVWDYALAVKRTQADEVMSLLEESLARVNVSSKSIGRLLDRSELDREARTEVLAASSALAETDNDLRFITEWFHNRPVQAIESPTPSVGEETH